MRITESAARHGIADEDILHAYENAIRYVERLPLKVTNMVKHKDDTGLDAVDPKTHPARDASHFRRIVAARKNLEAAEQDLRDAVKEAKEAGDSWAVVGAAMGTTRQAAFQRFGKS